MYEIMEMARKAFPFVIFGLAIWYLVNENKKGRIFITKILPFVIS